MTVDEVGSAIECFSRLSAHFLADSRVEQGTGFGSNPGLRVGGRIFAMVAGGQLVVKLPGPQVDELVSGGSAARFDAGKGRPMREWATVGVDAEADWDQLMAQAKAFVDRR